ncbi:S8 family serine peptidase [Nocardioides sp.]|uniref:S8 family serine peptidase n=1 Tax=Nocardioides sp. TaxID=35761 RepID=UPI002ED5AF3C
MRTVVRRSGARDAVRLAVTLVAGLALALPLAALPTGATHTVQAATTSQAEDERLYVVTFAGPGTAGYRGPLTRSAYRARLTGHQNAALSAVDAPAPVYRWTTALSGAAVELAPSQAARLAGQARVASVGENQVRRLTTTAAAPSSTVAPRSGRGGRGVVVGVVDTGVWPESPVFADSPALGPTPRGPGFAGTCRPGEDWSVRTCNAKLVAASWFVKGYGESSIAADEPLSARDVRGHGTQLASIAVGNAEVDVALPGLRTTFSGVAPEARLAAYKACWSAPDPDDDGCATADLVAAVDRATRDGVDVLSLGLGDAAGTDAVDRALLGAAESGIVVVAAAGNDGDREFAGHDSPWITTVGGLRRSTRTGAVEVSGARLRGAMTSRTPVRARIVIGHDVPAPGSGATAASVCRPGSLDAARVADRIVVCRRGLIGRVEKSAAVARAGGVGMVLMNTRAGSVAQDVHSVPTVHLNLGAARSLRRRLADLDHPRVTLRPDRAPAPRLRVATWSSAGDPGAILVKPDLVAPATGVLAASPPTAGRPWALASGTSAASAWTSGAAAVLLARRDWSEAAVRSALVGTASPLPGSVLRTGAGAPTLRRALRARLAHEVPNGAYRAWLVGARDDVNAPSLLARGSTTLTRRVTNLDRRTGTWTVSVAGIERYPVSVSPASLTLRPGQSAIYRVTVGEGSLVGGLDDGAIVWSGDRGDVVRVPLAITR